MRCELKYIRINELRLHREFIFLNNEMFKKKLLHSKIELLKQKFQVTHEKSLKIFMLKKDIDTA